MSLKKAIFISLIGHCFILNPPGNLWFLPTNKKIENPQITYYKITPLKAEAEKEIKTRKKITDVQPIQKQTAIVEKPKKQKSQIVKKIKRPLAAQIPQEIPPPKKENIVIVPESIPGTTLPNTPECVTYYQYIRAEIRRFLKRNYTSAYEEGAVYVSFALSQGGRLVSIAIVDEKSSSDSELRRLSYESIKNNTPFKPFPKGLSQNQISFSLPIVFKHR